VQQYSRQVFSISWIYTGLPAGTYEVGMCGNAPSPSSWNYNEFGYIIATVFAAS
jgi:hypothetical protein